MDACRLIRPLGWRVRLRCVPEHIHLSTCVYIFVFLCSFCIDLTLITNAVCIIITAGLYIEGWSASCRRGQQYVMLICAVNNTWTWSTFAR